jgi:two-component system, OmpR family, sensor kinase
VHRWRSGIRVRILAGSVAVLALATVASVLLVRQVLFAQLDDRLDGELVQESRELHRLARGIDPATGEPFGTDVERIFDVFLERNVPARNEAFLMFLDGELYDRSRTVLPYRLDEDAGLVGRWGAVTEPQAGAVETPGGTVRYLAVPIRGDGRDLGVFVAATFQDREAAEIEPAIRAAALVGVAALVMGSLLAARVARRILRSVESVGRAATSIPESDLTRRIEVHGDDEVAGLAESFNALLGRLEGAFQAQRAFVDDAGHELRTPITIVRGQLELLSEDPGERRRTLKLVTEELDRMSRIVNDLLLLAKAEQPSLLELDLLDVGELVRDVRAKVRSLAEREWVLEGGENGGIVADRERLTQALVQLVQNALEHTSDGDTIAIGAGVVRERARLWVRDSGPGISPEAREGIFERFHRVGARRSEGAGLGLAIVRAIAASHGGTASVESVPGEGATFTIEIPVNQPVPGEVA